MRHVLLFGVILSSVALLSAATASAQGRDARVTEIFVPQTSEFTQQHPGGVWSFDLSPDGKILAVEFGTHVPDANTKYGRFGCWVALWSVDAERLIATQQLEDDLPTYKVGKYGQGLPYRFYQHKLRLSADGQMLLVLT
jgi:hypothetical protein